MPAERKESFDPQPDADNAADETALGARMC